MGGRRGFLWAACAATLCGATARGDTQIIDSPTAQVLGHGQIRFYVVATQNLLATSYEMLTSLSGGIGYSLEPNRQSIDLFAGATQQLGKGLSLLFDYDFGLDDNANLDADRGYLDGGMQWRFGSGNHVRFLLRDLLGNYRGQGEVARELDFYYMMQL